jgi:hypothetical protein
LNPSHASSELKYESIHLSFNLLLENSIAKPSGVDIIMRPDPDGKSIVAVHLQMNHIPTEGRFFTDVINCTFADRHEESTRPPKISSSTTNSSETIQFIQQRLKLCDENHALCISTIPTGTWYPTRLIDVQPSGNDTSNKFVRIIITSENAPSGQYASLSHCWGKVQLITLKEENLERFTKEGIEISHLPNTFRHAVSVAESLRIRYIWIDSLCIIQDSVADWKEESRTMLQVYRHAYCNLAATHSRDSRGGLFSDRNPALLSADVQLSYGPLKATYRLTNINAGYWRMEVDEAPLNTRAWVVQERLISRRIVHFDSEQVIWDCSQSMACEALPGGSTKWANRYATGEFESPKQSSQLMAIPEREDQALGKWAVIITAYSNCSLTYQKDKIVAISGVARLLSESWKDQYCAGLWRKHIEFQLCWFTSQPINTVTRPPAELRAPSWSWLAFDGPVSASQMQMIGEEAYEVTIKASVTEVCLQDETATSGGEIIKGHLRMRCVLNTVVFDAVQETFCVLGRDGNLLPILRIDFDSTVRAEGEELYFIPLYDIRYQTRLDSPIKDASELRGIMVSLLDKASGTYVRCGHVFQSGSVAEERCDDAFLDLNSPVGKAHMPCLEFDIETGHLITLV